MRAAAVGASALGLGPWKAADRRRPQCADLVRPRRPGPAASRSRRPTASRSTSRNSRAPAPGWPSSTSRSPATGTCMVIDSIDVPRGVEKGLFEPLPEDKLPFGDLFPQVTMDGSTKVDGKRYGITEKFGYNTIGYNKPRSTPPTCSRCRRSEIRNTRAGSRSTTTICRSSAWRRWRSARRPPNSPRPTCRRSRTCS